MQELKQPDSAAVARPRNQRDAEGVLSPDQREGLRQRLSSAEPLFNNDPFLRELLARFVALPGVWGEALQGVVLKDREFFAALELEIVERCATKPSNKAGVEVAGAVSSLIENLYRSELCLLLASNGALTSDLFHRTEQYLLERSQRVQALCDSLLGDTLPDARNPAFYATIADLRDLPGRMRMRESLFFNSADYRELRPGDLISTGRYGCSIFLGNTRDREGEFLTYDSVTNEYRQYCRDPRSIYATQLLIERGGSLRRLYGDSPPSTHRLFRSGDQVEKPAGMRDGRSRENGLVLASNPDGSCLVLWKRVDLTVFLRNENKDSLRVFSHGKAPTRSSSLAAVALTDNPDSPLYSFVTALPTSPKDRDARALTSLCARVLAAQYPVALHVMGYQFTRFRVTGYLSRLVATCTQGRLPTEDPTYLRNHGCTPVVVVVNSDNNRNLTHDLLALQKKGWEIIVFRPPSRALRDEYMQHALTDLPTLAPNQRIFVVDNPDSPFEALSSIIGTIGSHANQALEERVVQRASHSGPKRLALDTLATLLDRLAEDTPTKSIARRPRELQLVRQVIDEIHRGEQFTLEQLNARFSSLVATLPDTVTGVTQTQESWSRRDLVEISGALAKSRLAPNHPAVLLRGITCLDLSPKALEMLLQEGGRIFRHIDGSGATRAVLIAWPPETTDKKRPGLSASLGRKGQVGYVHWVWVDPEGSRDVVAPYAKLVNRLVMEQLADGATFVLGRVLERNSPSILAARSVAGFDIIPNRASIAGEPAVAVGLDLSRDAADQAQAAHSSRPRALVSEALDVFISGLRDLSVNEELLGSNRLRVGAAHDFLVNASAFRDACEHILEHVSADLWWGDGNRLIVAAEDSLGRFAAWITDAQKRDLSRALKMCADDSLREAGKDQLQAILDEVVPESLRALKTTHARLREKAASLLSMEVEELPPRINPERLRRRAEAIPLPPPVDLDATRESHKRLPGQAKRILYHWWDINGVNFNWGDDLHPIPLSGHRENREKIEAKLERCGSLCDEPSLAPMATAGISDTTRRHFEEFSRIIAWTNQVAQAGHFDQHVARYLHPIFSAFFGRW